MVWNLLRINKGMKMIAFRENLAYQYTIESFTEKNIASIIRYYPFELSNFKNCLSKDSFDQVNNCLLSYNFNKFISYITYNKFLKKLWNNRKKADIWMVDQVKRNPNTTFG